MIVLLKLAGLATALMFLGLFCHKGPSWAKTVVKTIPLPALALICFASGGPMTLTLALLLCGIGDYALSRPGQTWFLVGLIAFALGHVAFAGVFVWGNEVSVTPTAIAATLILALIMVSTLWWLLPFTGALKPAVGIYVILIGIMIAAAFFTGQPAIVRLGVVAFGVSDLILAAQMFRMPEDSKWQRKVSMTLWTFYVTGPTLILAGFVPLL